MRRGVSFVLVVCLLFALVLPAAAQTTADFTDADAICNRSEVGLLVALGMIAGYEDGSFRPGDTLTRAQTAKLLALLGTDEPSGSLNGRFSDVSGGWASEYIAYCADRGILSGYGGLFRPDDAVTGRELAKMLLVATGSPAGRYTGAGWADAVDEDAFAAGIYDGYGADPAEVIDRDFACLLIYNAMQRPAVEGFDAAGAPVYVTDELLNPLTYLEHRFGVIRCSGVVTANEHADLSKAGGKLDEGMTRVAGYKDFALSTELGLVGRLVQVYVKNGQVIGRPREVTGASITLGTKSQLDRLVENSEYSVAYDAVYYYNYAPSTRQVLSQLPEGAEITVLDADGDKRFEQIMVTVYREGVVQADGRVKLEGGATVRCTPMTDAQPAEGQSVRCVQVGGSWYMK